VRVAAEMPPSEYLQKGGTHEVGGFLVADPRSNLRSGEDCLSEYPALKMRDAIAASDWRSDGQAPHEKMENSGEIQIQDAKHP